jgi:antitoxin HigA-1
VQRDVTLPHHRCSFLALLRYASAVTAASVVTGNLGQVFSPAYCANRTDQIKMDGIRYNFQGYSMDGYTSPARFLTYLMTEHNISVMQLCNRSGLDSDIAWAFLAGRLPVTQSLAEHLGIVFHSSGFWLTRQAMWSRFESDAGAPGDETPLC